MRRHNFGGENFVQENGPKNTKYAHKVDENWPKVDKMRQNLEFSVCTYKSQNFAQSKLNFAPLHNGETILLQNDPLHELPPQELPLKQTKEGH